MHAGLQFFDMPSNLLGGNGTQKIGIKMPGQTEEKSIADEGDFSEIMDALLTLTPEQLQSSLQQLEWVPVEGKGDLFAPVIDMSDMSKGVQALTQILTQENRQPGSSLPLDSLAEPLPPSIKRSADILPKIQPVISVPEISEEGAMHNKLDAPVADTNTFSKLDAREGFHKSPGLMKAEAATPNVTAFKDKLEPGDMAKAIETEKIAVSNKAPVNTSTRKAVSTADSLKTEVSTTDSLKTTNVSKAEVPIADPRQSLDGQNAGGQKNNAGLVRPEFQNQLATIGDQSQPEETRSKSPVNANSDRAVAVENFKVISDALPNSNDKIVNSAHQAKEAPLREGGRQTVQNAQAEDYLEKVAEKINKVQPNSNVKDATLSFSSRWTAMTQNNLETVTASNATSTTPEKTDSNDLIRQIVQRMTLKTRGFQSQMNIRLKPEFLGNVRMQITTDNQQVAVRMVADSSAVKEVIEQNLQYLKAELQQHGLDIEKFDVSVGKESDENRQGQQNNSWQRRAPHRERQFDENNPGKFGNKESNQDEEALTGATSSSESEVDYFA